MERINVDKVYAANLLSRNLLNILSYTNVYSYYLLYGLLIVVFFIRAFYALPVMSAFSAVIFGLWIWTLIEYCIHRFFFHLKAENKIMKIILFIFHDVHHAFPQEVSRSITPLMFSLPLAAFVFIVYSSVFGIYSDGLVAGSLLGYVIYSIVHDSTHHLPMNFPLAKQLKRHHLRHHYFDNNKNFGVTTTLWDRVFKTYE